MTSPAKLRANRRNAQKSTGPRTAAGKARAVRNARRHPFNLPVLADAALTREVVDLARSIETSVTGRPADALGHAHACTVAELIIDLRRLRDAKLPLIAALHADPAATAGPLRALTRLDRYERRALWRRKRAIRAFIAAITPAAHPPCRQSEPNGENPMTSATRPQQPPNPWPNRAKVLQRLVAESSRRADQAHAAAPRPPRDQDEAQHDPPADKAKPTEIGQ